MRGSWQRATLTSGPATSAESTPASPSFSFARVGVVLAFERADADAVDRAPALLALGQPALDAEHRQPGALLLGVLGAGEGAGLDEVGERVAAGGQACDAFGAAALAATAAGALAPAAGRVGRAARRRAAAGSTPGGAAPSRSAAARRGAAGRRRGRLGAGFLPASGLFGSQLRLRSASAASWSAVRCGTLLTNGHRHLGHVQRDAERERQADQQADDQADQEAAALAAVRWGAFMRCSGLSRPCARARRRRAAPAHCGCTWRVAASSARRARASSASSTRKRSARVVAVEGAPRGRAGRTRPRAAPASPRRRRASPG